MVYEFKFPDIGEGITKGTIVKWSVKPGDKVKEDDTLAQVETDKAVADIPSPKTGVIDKIMIPEGKDVAVGQTLVTIKVEGETTSDAENISKPATPLSKSEVKPAGQSTEKKDSGTGAVGELEESSGNTNLFSPKKSGTERPLINEPTGLAMPSVRHTAKQLGIDISKLQGTGSQGQVTKADLQNKYPISKQTPTAVGSPTPLKITTPSGDTIEITGSVQAIKFIQSGNQITTSVQTTPVANTSAEHIPKQTEGPSKSETIEKNKGLTVKRKYDDYGYIERKAFTHLRKTIANNLRQSVNSAVHVTAMDEIDVTDLWKLRAIEEKKAKKKNIKLTFLPYITRACIQALRKVPALNSTLDEENEEIILKKYYNMGQAVATEYGLMVIVVKRAENKTLYLIAKDIQELAQKARNRKIDISDLKGSSFTITNWGSIGGSYGTPIINPNEAGILGVGRIRQVPYLINKKTKLRYLLPVSLTFDHRITDGAEAATFLQELKSQLENPKGLEDKTFMKKLKEEEIFDI